jgi:hypothetical protein
LRGEPVFKRIEVIFWDPSPRIRESTMRGIGKEFMDKTRYKHDLREVIEGRRSVRAYSGEPFTVEELSWLLWACQGVKEVVGRPATLRTVPSAGARHPFETYVLVNKVEGLAKGLYRFLATEHKLTTVNMEDDIADRVTEGCYKQRFVKETGGTASGAIGTCTSTRVMLARICILRRRPSGEGLAPSGRSTTSC